MVMLLRFPASIDRARVDAYLLPGDAADFPATMGQLRNSTPATIQPSREPA
jgi:hypothetical protein